MVTRRRKWKADTLATLREAAAALGNVSEAEVIKAVRDHRGGKPGSKRASKTNKARLAAGKPARAISASSKNS